MKLSFCEGLMELHVLGNILKVVYVTIYMYLHVILYSCYKDKIFFCGYAYVFQMFIKYIRLEEIAINKRYYEFLD